MGYQNVKSGTLRAQRQQARRQAASAPVGQTGIGHGDGLRIYDKGRVVVDGEIMKIILQVVQGEGHITLAPTDRAGLRADPAFWATKDMFVVAGPLRDGSQAATGYGGSNLFLHSTSAQITAGVGGPTTATVYVTDTGWARMHNDLGSVRVTPSGQVAMFGPKADVVMEADGTWSIGDRQAAVIQAVAGGGLRLYGGGSRITAWGSFRVEGDQVVTGSKNFIMDHPEKPGWTIKYGATESPVSAIECRGRVTIGEDGTAPVEFPEHFAAIVKPGTDVDVWLSPYGPDAAWCELPTATGATIHGTPGAVVAWTTTAERTGGDFTVVEAGSTAPAPRPQPPSPPEPQEASQWQSPDTSQAGSQT